MLSLAQRYISEAPHLAFYPAGCIIVVALGLHADGRVAARGARPEVEEVTR